MKVSHLSRKCYFVACRPDNCEHSVGLTVIHVRLCLRNYLLQLLDLDVDNVKSARL
jgi:hypothetical protein